MAVQFLQPEDGAKRRSTLSQESLLGSQGQGDLRLASPCPPGDHGKLSEAWVSSSWRGALTRTSRSLITAYGATQWPQGTNAGPAQSACYLVTHVLVNLEDYWRRVEVHLVLVHQHREAPDLLGHRRRHLRKEAHC